MVSKYEQYYELLEALSQNPRLIPSGKLWNFDTDRLYAAAMDMLAQPLANGQESPFSSRSPATAHAIFMSVFIQHLDYIGYEMNLLPDRALVEIFRMLGAELAPSEYPVLNMRFWRTSEAKARGIDVVIEGGAEIRSRFNSSLAVYTYFGDTIDGTKDYVDIPARTNQEGVLLAEIGDGEFTQMVNFPPFIEKVENIGVVSQGREAETLAQAMLRSREGIRTGNLGRFFEDGLADFSGVDFLGRCVTPRDFQYHVERLGANKVAVLPGIQYGSDGYFPDLVSLAIYPPQIVPLVQESILNINMLGQRLGVISAEIVPITGTVQIKITSDISYAQARNLAAEAIASKINPPNGKWGDLQFPVSLAKALEEVQGIYAVPSMDLRDERINAPVDFSLAQPWQLFEIQDSIVFDAQF